MHHEIGWSKFLAPVMPDFRHPVVVDRVAEFVRVVGLDVLLADDPRQFAVQH